MGDRDLLGGGGATNSTSGEEGASRLVDWRWGDGAVKVDSDDPSSLYGRKGECLMPVDVPGWGEGSLAGDGALGNPRAANLDLRSLGTGALGGLAEVDSGTTGRGGRDKAMRDGGCTEREGALWCRGERSRACGRPLVEECLVGESVRGAGSRRLRKWLDAEEYRERKDDLWGRTDWEAGAR